MPKTRTIDVTIRIDKAARDHITEIRHALESSGLTNVDVHERVSMISGSVAADAVDALRKVNGVASVRQDQVYKTQVGYKSS